MQKIYKITSVAICIKYLVTGVSKAYYYSQKRAVAATSIITTATRVATESENNSRRNNDNTNMLARPTARYHLIA